VASPKAPPTERLLRSWDRLSPLPGGTWLFSRLLGIMVPYTGTVGAHVRELRAGYCRVTLRDRGRVRNHLNSIHAIALANLGEVTSGLAMIAALRPGVRSILTSLSIEFVKKARGVLTAECSCSAPNVEEPTEQAVTAEIRDAEAQIVARVVATWRLSPP